MKVIAFGAHLDDIELACGGTLARAVHQGHVVKMVCLTRSAYDNFQGHVLRTEETALEEGRVAARHPALPGKGTIRKTQPERANEKKSVEP